MVVVLLSRAKRLSPAPVFFLRLRLRLSGRSFVCYQTREHNVLVTNEPILMQISTSSPRAKGMKQSTFGVRRSKVKVTRDRR